MWLFVADAIYGYSDKLQGLKPHGDFNSRVLERIRVVRHRVAAVDVIPVRADMTTPRGPSILTYHHRETLFIKLTTDTGLVGWGETYRLAGAESVIRDVLGPMLVGQDRTPVESAPQRDAVGDVRERLCGRRGRPGPARRVG